MLLSLANREVEGSASDLFFYPNESLVYKLFRGKRGTRAGDRSRAVFGAEVAAYRLLQGLPDLSVHAPKYFGTVQVAAVLAADGTQVPERYLLDCCYSVELLSGPCVKVFGVPPEHQDIVLALMERFEKVGIRHVADADCNGWDSPATIKLLDFATYDALAGYA